MIFETIGRWLCTPFTAISRLTKSASMQDGIQEEDTVNIIADLGIEFGKVNSNGRVYLKKDFLHGVNNVKIKHGRMLAHIGLPTKEKKASLSTAVGVVRNVFVKENRPICTVEIFRKDIIEKIEKGELRLRTSGYGFVEDGGFIRNFELFSVGFIPKEKGCS